MRAQPLTLHIPKAPSRWAGPVDVASLEATAPAGSASRPTPDAAPATLRALAFSLIRVLDEKHLAIGPWDPRVDSQLLLQGLRAMLLTRAFDEQMFRAQRQGKTSFYMKCTGEEAIACAQALRLEREDMCFPSYRQQGILITRGYPLVEMMHQIFNNACDPLKGHQLPILYSARECGFFTVSGNVGTQYCQAVGWAMASAYSADKRIASAWIGEGGTATADFHHALTFAAVYRAPVILNIVNNQWAISSPAAIAGADLATFAARGIGYGLPALRVDGNDFLAVYAATQWAAERARADLGATVIEFVTYRVASHSTSDDPSKYRAAADSPWPLGDPIERLKRHLIGLDVWSERQHGELCAEVRQEVVAAARAAEAQGTLGVSKPPLDALFEDVYATPDPRLEQQRQELSTMGS